MLNNTVSEDANNDKPVRSFKILLTGYTRSGKTAALRRYCFDSFKDQHLSTIGIDFAAKNVMVQGQKYKAIIWDTSGQERYRNITLAYFRGSEGVFIFYNVRFRDTFEYVRKVLKEVEKLCSSNVPVLLVGSASDAIDRTVSFDEGVALAQSIRSPDGIPFFEISSKTNQNVEDMYQHMYEMVLKLRPCVCLNAKIPWKPGLHTKCHDVQKIIFKLVLLKNLRSFDGMKFPNEIVLYIFSFLGVAVNEMVWYGKAGVELKNENDDTQVTKYEKNENCVCM